MKYIPNFLTENQQLAQSTKTEAGKKKITVDPGLFRVKKFSFSVQ